jgi:hypothetical protein
MCHKIQHLTYLTVVLTNLLLLHCLLSKQPGLHTPIAHKQKISLPKTEYALNEEIDLSNHLTAGVNSTTYIWKTPSGITLIKDVDYTESNGKFTFKAPPTGYFYCKMKNTTFPDLTLTTENIYYFLPLLELL